jgi:hypothetical protein
MADLCPGTLVVHSLPDAECTDPRCVDCQEPRHALVIPCADIDGDCPLCAHDRVTRPVAA